jgi:hypothetical protein
MVALIVVGVVLLVAIGLLWAWAVSQKDPLTGAVATWSVLDFLEALFRAFQ